MLRMNPPGHENAIIDNYVPIYRCGVSSKQLRTICIIKIFFRPGEYKIRKPEDLDLSKIL